MNTLQIDYFMAVATNLSFTKTSEELYVSQPAISKQISLLEKELGTKLFYRNNKQTMLTEAGQLYYDLFRDFKIDLRNTNHKVSIAKKDQESVVTIGFLEGWDLTRIMPMLLSRTKQKYPNIDLNFCCCGIKELSTLILIGSIDLAVTMKNAFSKLEEVECIDVNDIKKILLFSKNHPLASKKNLSLEDFKDETFIAPYHVAEETVSRIIMSYCEPYRFTPKIKFVHNNETMITCVRNNLGVGFSDEWSWAKEASDIGYIDINISDTISVASMQNITDNNINFVKEIIKDIVEEI